MALYDLSQIERNMRLRREGPMLVG